MSPTYPTVQQQAPPPSGRPAWLLVVCAVVGLAVGIGAGALLFGSDDSSTKTTSAGSPTAGASTKPVSLPSTLGGFRDLVDVVRTKAPKPDQVKRQSDNQSKVRSATEAAYSKAFGGAATAYRAYSDGALLKTPYVIAVRAPAPGLTIGRVEDPAFLGLRPDPGGEGRGRRFLRHRADPLGGRPGG